jgi:hypothetical protein
VRPRGPARLVLGGLTRTTPHPGRALARIVSVEASDYAECRGLAIALPTALERAGGGG